MNKKLRALVCGAGGFIGTHLVRRLKAEGYWVRGVDLKYPEYSRAAADEFIIGDLRDKAFSEKVIDMSFDQLYNLAADMGGAGYMFTGEHDADVMYNLAVVNLNVIDASKHAGVKKVFYPSSACIYPAYNLKDPANPDCSEDSAYPAAPDTEYGWTKLFSERLYLAFNKNYGLKVTIARFHNIFGPESAWTGGREKFPAAICRKVAEARDGGEIRIWGDGNQTRSFLYIDECIEAVLRFMSTDYTGPMNIGSSEMVTINELTGMVVAISKKRLKIVHEEGPVGVKGRNSDNALMAKRLSWVPSMPLRAGLEKMYQWVREQVRKRDEA